MKSAYEKVRRLPLIGPIAETLAQPFSRGYVLTVKKTLDRISPSICAAKWYQTTLYMESGETHSCHHPVRHKIDTTLLAQEPSALHNTPYKKSQRQLMLNGVRPSECSYCWKVEDSGGLSDRHYKSAEDWAMGLVEGLGNMKGDESVDPRYLEVSFSSLCQLKCSYCDPTISSSIASEIEKYGAYPTSRSFGMFEKKAVDQAQLTNAFWKWWPELKPTLKVLRLTGGEPLLHDEVLQVLADLRAHPAPHLKLSLTSNLMISSAKLEAFILEAQGLVRARAVNSLHLYTSIDTWGEQAEWLRAGLKISTYTQNLEKLLQSVPSLELTFLVTFNVLSLYRYTEFLDYVLWLRGRYPAAKIKVGVSYLHYPNFLSIDVLPRTQADLFEKILTHYRANAMDKRGSVGFSPSEIERFERIFEAWKQGSADPAALRDLKTFIQHYDLRKNLNFAEAFPAFWPSLEV